jgi:hypothetical protein
MSRVQGALHVRQSPRLAARLIEGKGVVIVIDRQELHTLNGVGMRVFELADGRSVEEIATALTEEFAVSRKQALADAGSFVRELLEMGALEDVSP